MAPSSFKPFVPSDYQAAIQARVADPRGGSIAVIAVAGSGKTKTAEICLPLIPEHASVQMLAFNSTIAKELTSRIEKLRDEARDPDCPWYGRAFRNVSARTFHSLGGGAVAKKLGCSIRDLNTDDRKCQRIVQDWLPDLEIAMYGEFICKLVSFAKGEGIGAIARDEVGAWQSLIDHHNLILDSDEADEDKAIDLARELLDRSNRAALGRHIDFDDMIYLPLLWKLRLWQNDWVIGDEWQDTNPTRRALAALALKPASRGGRIMVLGDPRQAIYGFCHPAGTPILTPSGWVPVESISASDPAVVFNTSGDASGWTGGNPVVDTTVHDGWDAVIRVRGSDRYVDLTPHHKIPVKIQEDPCFYTYVMRRNGAYRAGYCASHAAAGTGERRFMLSQRCLMEGADAAWILARHDTREDAEAYEAGIHARGVPGQTWCRMNDVDIERYKIYHGTKHAVTAVTILSEHGRMSDFPLWVRGRRQHFEVNLPFITEACNIVGGMRVQVLGEWDDRRRGRSRHTGEWVPATVERGIANPSGLTYGITVTPISGREGYQNWPLYAAGIGGGIIVHNTGATCEAIEITKREHGAVEMPLTVSYRCARSVVEKARSLVDYIEPAPNAPDGKVEQLPVADALRVLDDHDAILCRKTAPLISMAFHLIGQGRGCVVLGREIGQGLVSLIKKMRASTVAVLDAKLQAYEAREVAKYEARDETSKVAAVRDRVACIRAVMDGMGEDCAVADLIRSIEGMFRDTNGVLTLCTVHKAKGKEWRRVAILEPECMPSPWARQEWQYSQEINLMYVAWTRAMEHLILMEGGAGGIP